MFGVAKDSAEYRKRLATPFRPPKATFTDIHSAIPRHLYKKSTLRGLFYVFRDVAAAYILYKLGCNIDSADIRVASPVGLLPAVSVVTFKWLLWILYWFWQGIVLAGWWCIAHEAGHGTLSCHGWVNHLVGFTLHTFILVPYYAWRSTHHAHHKATSSIEKDENYVPRTRLQYNLPPERIAHSADYLEVFEETPIYTLSRMLFMQLIGWQYYLTTNVMGNPKYPQGTNHFQPSSPLFKPHEREGIVASNVALSIMVYLLYLWSRTVGISYFIKLYFIPYLLANNWIVMLTFLHHSDPSIPHYRNKQWTFLRGALATVDRPLLGWIGRVFLHNVSHDHVAHHLFSSIPFYNQPHVTELLKEILKDDYNFDSTNAFRALYRNFTECCFIEDEGDIVFYKNSHGEAARLIADDALSSPIRGVECDN